MTIFESVRPKTVSHLTHNKFWIFDHHQAILGGQNIMDSENLGTGLNEGARDTEVYIDGPVATDLSLTFARIWEKNRTRNHTSLAVAAEQYAKVMDEEKSSGKRGRDHYQRVLTNSESLNNGVCRVLSQEPGEETPPSHWH